MVSSRRPGSRPLSAFFLLNSPDRVATGCRGSACNTRPVSRLPGTVWRSWRSRHPGVDLGAPFALWLNLGGSTTRTAEIRRIRVLISLGIAAGLAGFTALYPSRSLGQEARPNPAARQMMTDAAVDRIATESRGILREPSIEAAPLQRRPSSIGPCATRGPRRPTVIRSSPTRGRCPRRKSRMNLELEMSAPVRILTGLGRQPRSRRWPPTLPRPDVTGPSAGYGSRRTQIRMTSSGHSKARAPRSSVPREA